MLSQSGAFSVFLCKAEDKASLPRAQCRTSGESQSSGQSISVILTHNSNTKCLFSINLIRKREIIIPAETLVQSINE